jgi:hypothetical protein
MRAAIVPDDNLVYVEEHAQHVDCSSLPEDVHAIQWHDGRGWIEYKTDADGNRKMNFCIVDFSPYQYLVDAWMVEAQKELPPPTPASVEPIVTPSSEAVRVIAD